MYSSIFCDKKITYKIKKTLFLGKKSALIHIHIFHRTVARSNFYWLLKLGSSSGSASLLVLPSQFPSDIVKTRSALQLRDSTGISPVSLLSIATPNFQYFIFIFTFVKLIDYIFAL